MKLSKKLLLRAGYIFVSILLMYLLYFYTFSFNSISSNSKSYSTQEFINDPSIAHDEEKTIMGVYVDSFEGGFHVLYNHKVVTIYSDRVYEPPQWGEVNVRGLFHQNGTITALYVHNYNYNYWLYVFSAFAVFFVILLFFTEWKITSKGIKERGKNA